MGRVVWGAETHPKVEGILHQATAGRLRAHTSRSKLRLLYTRPAPRVSAASSGACFQQAAAAIYSVGGLGCSKRSLLRSATLGADLSTSLHYVKRRFFFRCFANASLYYSFEVEALFELEGEKGPIVPRKSLGDADRRFPA